MGQDLKLTCMHSHVLSHTPSNINLYSYKWANCTHWLLVLEHYDSVVAWWYYGSYRGSWLEQFVLPLRTVSHQAQEDLRGQVVIMLGWTSKQKKQNNMRADYQYIWDKSMLADYLGYKYISKLNHQCLDKKIPVDWRWCLVNSVPHFLLRCPPEVVDRQELHQRHKYFTTSVLIPSVLPFLSKSNEKNLQPYCYTYKLSHFVLKSTDRICFHTTLTWIRHK